jgi:hypothetical protein
VTKSDDICAGQGQAGYPAWRNTRGQLHDVLFPSHTCIAASQAPHLLCLRPHALHMYRWFSYPTHPLLCCVSYPHTLHVSHTSGTTSSPQMCPDARPYKTCGLFGINKQHQAALLPKSSCSAYKALACMLTVVRTVEPLIKMSLHRWAGVRDASVHVRILSIWHTYWLQLLCSCALVHALWLIERFCKHAAMPVLQCNSFSAKVL